MAVQFPNMYRVDLEKGPAVKQLNRMFYADAGANRIGAYLYKDGIEYEPGGSCAGTAILANGGTVALTGVVSGNQVYVDLQAACYSTQGPIQVFVTWTDGETATTVVAGFGNVTLTETGTVIDPGTIIPSVTALISAIETAVATIPASYSTLLAAIAPQYTDLTFPVSAGRYCWYSGVLYRAKEEIATSESWTAAHWETAVFAEDVAALRHEVDDLASILTEQSAVDFSSATVINANISGTTGKWVVNNSYETYMIPVPANAGMFKATAGESSASFSLLKSNTVTSGSTPDYATGCTTENIAAGGKGVFLIPGDANYLAIRKTVSDVDYTPSSVVFSVDIHIPAVDETLTTAGDAADAKATGDALALINGALYGSGAVQIALTGTAEARRHVVYNTGELAVLASGSTVSASDYIDITGCGKIRYSRLCIPGSSSTAGMAFYDAGKTYTSGQQVKLNAAELGYELTDINVPSGAKYARFTLNSAVTTSFALYDITDLTDGIITKVGGLEDSVSALEAEVDALSGNTHLTVSPPGWEIGKTINSSGAISSYSTTALSLMTPVVTPLYRGGALADGNGIALNAYIAQYNGNTFIERTLFNTLNQAFSFNENCTQFRVLFGRASSSGVDMTQNDIDTYFTLYTDVDMQEIYDDVQTLKSYHPNYTGKIVSILGDSISTFVPDADKVDGKAPAGCETTYPGNVTQYENSDVNSVAKTWWGRVLARYGMQLGINESWGGSTIGFNSSYTSSGKYTADNCMCSATRIGHLGENGTPDLILVFGGTNDINHHMSGNNVRFAVGSLDNTHNPYDFDNFPMLTDTYYGAITTMLLRLQHSYPNATLLMILPYFCTYTHTSSGDIASPYDQNEWSKAAIDVCNYLGVEYLDLRTIINLYDVSSLLFDGLHPKANGMEAIAKAVIHKLDSML